jgi:uracil-DNA glycosylase
MNAKKIAFSIANCDNYNDNKENICHDFYAHHNPCHFPEPWNGDIEKARFLVISSNPSYNSGETEYPLYKNLTPESWNTSTYYFFMNRLKKHGHSNKFWKAIDKWIHWIHGIEDSSVPNNVESIKEYRKSRLNISNYLNDEICITNICHCKSTGQQFVYKCVDECAKKHLQNVLSCFNGEFIIVVGAIALRYKDEIQKYNKAKILIQKHPNARKMKDADRIQQFINDIL